MKTTLFLFGSCLLVIMAESTHATDWLHYVAKVEPSFYQGTRDRDLTRSKNELFSELSTNIREEVKKACEGEIEIQISDVGSLHDWLSFKVKVKDGHQISSKCILGVLQQKFENAREEKPHYMVPKVHDRRFMK